MARETDYIRHLGEVALFADCTRKDLQEIARRTTSMHVKAGKVLTTEGAAGREFFVIDSGTASVRRNGRKIATLGPGQAFGELALLTNAPRNATITAESDMELLVLTRSEFSSLLDAIPKLSKKLLESLAKRVAEVDTRSVH